MTDPESTEVSLSITREEPELEYVGTPGDSSESPDETNISDASASIRFWQALERGDPDVVAGKGVCLR